MMSRISLLFAVTKPTQFFTPPFSRSIHIHYESHCQFVLHGVARFAFKDVLKRKRWHPSPSPSLSPTLIFTFTFMVELDLRLSRRILPTNNGKTSLLYFEGGNDEETGHLKISIVVSRTSRP